MLARPKARNALAAALQVSLNLPPKSKPAPAPEPELDPDPEPVPTPEPEVEPESPQRKVFDAINEALRGALQDMHERDAARRECSQCLDDVIDRVITDEERRVVEEARADAERSFVITRLMNDLIDATETRAADIVADQCAVVSQICAEMASQLVEEELRRCAHECWITVKTPTVVRRDVPAWQHGQPRGADVVNGVSHVTMRVDARDLAPTMTLNPYAPVFTPRGFYGL